MTATKENASDAARWIFFRAGAVLVAFLIRDILEKIWEHVIPVSHFWVGIMYRTFLLVAITGLTILMAVFWEYHDTLVV